MLLIHQFFNIVLKIHINECITIILVKHLLMAFGVVKDRCMIPVKYRAYLIKGEPPKSSGNGCKQGTKSYMLRSGSFVVSKVMQWHWADLIKEMHELTQCYTSLISVPG